MEEENDLKHFLKVVRPDWSLPRRKGHCDIARACEKLKAIGVRDVSDLLRRVADNTINDDLSQARKPRFSRETIQSMKKEGAFWHSLSHLSEPSYRQIGLFAPVPQMMSDRNLRTEALKTSGMSMGALHPVTGSFNNSSSEQWLRPNTSADTSSLRSWAPGSSAMSSVPSESPRMRPSSMALSIPKSAILEDDVDDTDFSTLPRLRGARVGPSMRDTSHLAWKRAASTSALPSDNHSIGRSSRPPLANDQPETKIQRCMSMTSDGSFGLGTPHHCSSATAESKSNASQTHDADMDLSRRVDRWNRIGAAMVTDPLTPGWSSLHPHTLLQHGEAMMREQEDLQHKRKLYQQIALEGKKSPMRQHLAEKIETRLREEKSRDAAASMEVQQSCMSIRKHIAGMSNARKNLNTLRLEARHALQPHRQTCTVGLSLDIFPVL